MKYIQQIQSDSRISICAYNTDKFKSENISVYLGIPADSEKNVVRSLLLSVLKRGTEKYSSQQQINERLDEMYATLVNLKNHKTDDIQLLGISADFIKPDFTDGGEDLLDSALDVIKEILFCPGLDETSGMFVEEYVDSEKENYKSIVLSQLNEPRTYAAIRCREEMFASLDIGDRISDVCDKIDSTYVADVFECYNEIIRNARIFVFYVGPRLAEEIREHIESIFGKRVGACDLAVKRAEKILKDTDTPNEIIESSEITQGRLVMGLNCGVTWHDSDYYAMLLCNEILGASQISKLMTEIREKLALCYECSSVYNSARGAIFVTMGLDAEKYELAKNAILEQISEIKCGRISEVEFISAKKSIYNHYSAVSDSPNAIERYYLTRILNGVDVDLEQFLEKIDALMVSDVVRAANKLTLHTLYFLRGQDERGEDVLCEQ